MGEVYKAEDLKLKQIVALKFLPEALALDGASLARFQNEVRITRQISHANVCRVYDIGETQGLHFLSMEFIDGEDMSLLLRRIGRLPGDKANEIARQICAGLAAAHENGVLHRDLKPANIMIDGRGKARVTDFGVAVVAKELLGAEATSGTPAYMAPEQLKGKEVTQKSDIYSLGLVLYELFTGKRAYNSDNMIELMSLHESSSPTSPSSYIEHIDPMVERVIMRCLEKDPDKRPASALQVAAALPGGDPLAAALAAGETPSPEMVAASGEKTGLRPAVAITLLAATIIGLGLVVLAGMNIDWPGRLLREYSPAELTHKAQDTIQRLGYAERPAESASGIFIDEDHRQYVAEKYEPGTQWTHSLNDAPSLLGLWYRQSPRYLQARTPASFGWILENDPQNGEVSGMVSIRLDPAGRMTYFKAVPPQVDAPGNNSPIEWAPLFAAAGLDQNAFVPTESTWVPTTGFDTRAAWTGTYPDQPDVSIRLEASAYRGKPTYFNVIAPWQRPSMQQEARISAAQNASTVVVILLLLTPLIGATILARRNLRKGRGDRRGAARVSFFVFMVAMLAWLFGADHHATVDQVEEFFVIVLSQTLLLSGFVWLLYVALEPYVRRRWPQNIVSWTRVLAGNLRDPLVGKDVLTALCLGVVLTLLFKIQALAHLWAGMAPGVQATDHWLGTRELIAEAFVANINGGVFIGLFFFFLIFLLRIVVRRDWVAVPLFALILSIPAVLQDSDPVVQGPLALLVNGLVGFVCVRFGLLAAAVAVFVSTIPLADNFSPWYMSYMIGMLVFVAALAGWAFHTSLGGEKVFSGSLLED